MNEPKFFGTAKVSQTGQLTIGGIEASELAAKYGTPLYVYDVALIRERARGFRETFEQLGVAHQVSYASKAFACIAMYQLAAQEKLGVDVVSGGELATALKAGFPAKEIAFHGNNKTATELAEALDAGIGKIIIDNFYEIQLLAELLAKRPKQQQTILLRLSPGVDAHTHEFIMTGQEDSKFGFDVKSGQADQALQAVLANPQFEMAGVHCHIGSQIFQTEGFHEATKRMIDLLVRWRKEYAYVAHSLNLGGGFGVRYTEEDTPLEAAEYVRQITAIVQTSCEEVAYPLPEIIIEPGRSLVAEAGTTLYTVGSRKDLAGIRTFVAVDGGMGDNIRPALYQADYTGYLANRMAEAATETVTIVGKYCESGDQLIADIPLPKAQSGDLFAMPTTGAYGYSMANNYNRNPRPAVVFVENGQSFLAVKRETYQDLWQLDCFFPENQTHNPS